jgi:transcriptional regulator with XRE-family HTH domain
MLNCAGTSRRKPGIRSWTGDRQMTIQDIFIANLKDYRKLRSLSQMRLAEKCGSSQQYIAQIEVGKQFPSVDMIEKIALALEIESHILFKIEHCEDGPAGQRLNILQKQEIIDKIAKIINHY